MRKNLCISGTKLTGPGSLNFGLEQVKKFLKQRARDVVGYLDKQVEIETKARANKMHIKEGTKQYNDLKKQIKEEVKKVFNVIKYEEFFNNSSILDFMEGMRAKEGQFIFREWEVPMIKIDLDPKSAIVTGVSLTLGNNIAKMHIQMQDEPTYQHIGGRDTFINISMRVIGEKELNKLKRIFDHVNALARLNHSSGVLGFIGIKNIITALSGVKYVIPSNYSVSTIPGYPHVYDVNISLLDFDIFQQSREKLSSSHQKQLIEEFGTKRNPFLRIKQMWGIFNAYPDFPLSLKDKENNVVGHLDPDFYFRSFEMFDKEVIYSFKGKPKELKVPGDRQGIGQQTLDIVNHSLSQEILNLLRMYQDSVERKHLGEKGVVEKVISILKANDISYENFLKLLSSILRNPNLIGSNPSNNYVYNTIKKNMKLITDQIEYTSSVKVSDVDASWSNKASNPQIQVGKYSTAKEEITSKVQYALAGGFNLKEEKLVSFHLDDLDFVANMYTMPIIDPDNKTKVPAMLSIGSEVHFGYIDTEKDGRFYLTVDGVNVKSEGNSAAKLTGRNISDDFSDPTKAVTKNAITGLQSLNNYGNPYTGGIEAHWQNILIDTQYRDISGRMIRAFPTYMLWLIDEGGHFAGVKVFDNFYGLQSIIDFSVVSSEDLLGDTLIIRLSNLYAKLTTKESSSLYSDDYTNPGDPSITAGLSRIIDTTLNKARYVTDHIRNDYVVDIENIRLKPGVRVHLRGGYGANPNSLQTLFNGTITQVEQGEIVTVTAQSDAIELGAIVNSTKKKGDSGRVDGGINTGLWLSEPRDLMVRLLSMGASRFRESIAHAQKGLIFSENKFGIRHFGNMLYEPMSAAEERRHLGRITGISDAYNAVGNFNFSDPALRPDGISLMNQLWANFSSQKDLEIFKRNIYPGNGTGIAQFLGGDLGDGWTSVSSITPDSEPNERINYLSRLSDRSWNDLVSRAGQSGSPDAKNVVDSLTSSGQIPSGDSSSMGAAKTLPLAGAALIAAPFSLPVAAGALVGAGLLGSLSGRGGTNFARMLGLVSANNDDDMPGFDEVSFRAQTYMRSIWDLFRVCARLLPNYIVAVRPFEDRSTIFYGKPHWLYTSGVVPITTGILTEEKLAELGYSNGVKINDKEDESLQQIIDKLARQISPYADQEAFLRDSEPNQFLSQYGVSQQDNSDIFQPAGVLNNKIINFDSEKSQKVMKLDKKTNKEKVVAKLPQKKGFVTLGFHLPIRKKEEQHRQISQLPKRFRFPFFSYKLDSAQKLNNFSFQFNEITYDLPFGSSLKDEFTSGFFGSSLHYMLQVDTSEGQDRAKTFVKGISSVYGEEFVNVFISDVNFFTKNELSGLVASKPLENAYNFSSFEDLDNENSTIQMPLPEPGRGEINFKDEWGIPETAMDEQFYIAMRWPYLPKNSADQDKLISKYFPGTTKSELVGEAKDYKQAHVMVYNSRTNIAVICKPAYFLWGEKRTKFVSYSNNIDVSDQDGFIENALDFAGETLFSAFGYKADNPSTTVDIGQADIAAVVSPDAAYYLGILSSDVNILRTTEYSAATSTFRKEFSPGYNDMPIPHYCSFAFVPNTVPLGVAATSFSPIKRFKAKNGQGEEVNDFLLGFGNFEGEELIATVSAPNPLLLYPGTTKNNLDEYTTTAISSSINYPGRR